MDVDINLEIVPVVLNGEKFDYSKFYGVNKIQLTD
jgi:hypothetical protein